MDKDPTLRVRDLATRETFTLRWDNTAFVNTMDGVRVKLHPISLRLLVPKGGKFEGNTLLGPRKMERI
jgi:hypothetical protein